MFQWALWCWGLQWPPLTSSSLRDPVLSCPEVLHCTRLGAAQYRMRRGGSRQEARKHHGPSAALTWLLPSKPPDPSSGLSGEPAPAFCSRQKAGPLLLPAARSADSGLPEIPRHLAKRGWQIQLWDKIRPDSSAPSLKEVTALTPALPGGPARLLV